MFRNTKLSGFVNEGLEVCEGNESIEDRKKDNVSTKIEITRTKYDQKKLHDDMLYKKPSPKSSEFLFSRTYIDDQGEKTL